MNLLQTISSPADLRQLNQEQLPELAAEIRQYLIETVSRTGGHLAPNLGVVELTLALHYAFDTPTDKLVWDVGHQCYTHKIITGRREAFAGLREKGGISGFCNRDESVYDTHTTGHSSNSISVALGLAQANYLNHCPAHVVAVIGDGALTGGMALEALNHAGHLGKPLIVVLNDNEMSIAGNVGAISRHLAKLRTNSSYNKAKDFVREELSHFSRLGRKCSQLISSGKRKLKNLLMPGMFFENLGFTYLGPIDGHNTAALIAVMRQAQAIKKPVVIHVRTTKGKGYLPAEQTPKEWHGVAPFCIESGLPLQNGKNSFTNSFSAALLEEAKHRPELVAITAAMADGTGLRAFAEQYPERFFDTGITEQHATTFAAGLAAAGFRPVLAIYSTFLQRAYDQLLEDICLQRLPVVLAIDRAGMVDGDGFGHQGIFDLAFLRTMPGMTVLAPTDALDLQGMLRYALQLNAPCAIRWPKAAIPNLPNHPHPAIEEGRSVLLREGNAGALIALGSMVEPALAAAELLQKKGHSFRVVDARFAAPIDHHMLAQAAEQCKRIVTLEEGVLAGGFGEGCGRLLANHDVSLLQLGVPQYFPPQGKREQLLQEVGLSATQIAAKIEKKWFS